ncbi:hypothetical protein [Streptomyces sp. NPDC059949]|uniref:hypothetical protein n=1 Tax=Streptomyces sp. NPDC059949 TaxID=3347013 RepID=UPI00365F5DB3
MTGAYPPAPQHLRAACVHPDGHLPVKVSAATLRIYLGNGLVYRNDGDDYRLPPDTAQVKGVGPYFITGPGRRAILSDPQRNAVDSADESGALGQDVSRLTASALARLALVEYRDAGGNVPSADGDEGRTSPRLRPYLTATGSTALATPPQT